MPSKTETREIKPGVFVTYEATILEPAVSEDFVLLSLEKVWVQADVKVGQDGHRIGFSFLPPAGKEIIIASARTGAGVLPDNCLSNEQFAEQLYKVADSVSAYQNRIIDNQKNKSSF